MIKQDISIPSSIISSNSDQMVLIDVKGIDKTDFDKKYPKVVKDLSINVCDYSESKESLG